jgi:hypothetical protein
MKKEHRYRVTVEHLQAAQPEFPLHETLCFEATNHDDVLAIVDRLRARARFDADTTAALAVGLKLFGEVALKHRDDPLFAPIMAPLREFIGGLKNS